MIDINDRYKWLILILIFSLDFSGLVNSLEDVEKSFFCLYCAA